MDSGIHLEHSWIRSSQRLRSCIYFLLYPCYYATLPLYYAILLFRGFPVPTPCTEKQARQQQDPSLRRGLHHKVSHVPSNAAVPLLTVSLVFSATDTGPDQGLLVVQDGQDTKDDGCTCLKLDIHQALRHGFADVLKVHGGPLDKASDSDDGVEWRGGSGGLRRGLGLGRCLGLRGSLLGGRGVVDEGEEVGGGCEHGRGGVGGLDLAGLDESVARDVRHDASHLLRPGLTSCTPEEARSCLRRS